LISIVQQQLGRSLDSGGARLSDGTVIGTANHKAAGGGASSPALPASASPSHNTLRRRRSADAPD